MKKSLLPIIFLIILTVSLIFFWFKEGLLVGNAESGLAFYNLSKYVQFSSYSWTDANLGYDGALLVGANPTYWILSLFEQIKVPSFLIQALFFWLILIVSSLSLFFLSKELFPEINNKIAILAVIFYLFNPFSLTNIWNRYLITQMVLSAALPFLLCLYLLALRRKKFTFAILSGLISFLFSFGLAGPSNALVFWGVLAFTTFFYITIAKKIKEPFFYLKAFFSTFIVFLVVNLWWIAKLIESNFTKARFSSVNFFDQNNLDTLLIESQLLGSFINTFRFLHGIYFTQGQEWARFFTFKPMIILEFLITAVVLLCIFIYRRNKEVLFLGLLFIIGLFLEKGNNLPFGGIFEFLFVKIPLLQAFRNPFEKLGIITVLAASLLFAKGLGGAFEIIKKDAISKILYTVTFLFLLFVWGKPFWSSEVFSSNENIPKDQAKSYKVKVPDYYKSAKEWFRSQNGNFRFISVPLRGEGISFNWEKPYTGVDLSYTLFGPSSISNNTTIPYFADFVSALSNYQLNSKILNFLPMSNIKYILLRNDINFLRDHMANPVKLEENLDYLVTDDLIKKVANFEDKLHIYELSQDWYWPKIYITNKVLVSNKSYDLHDIDRLDVNFPKNIIAVIDSTSVLEDKKRFNNWIIRPDATFFPILVNLDQNFNDTDILSKLPSTDSLPGQSGYLLSKIKEELEVPYSGINYWDQIIYRISLLSKRLVEIYKLKKQNIESPEVNQMETSFEGELDKISKVLQQRNKIGAQIPSFLLENMLLQYLLTKKIESGIQKSLKELLLNLRVISSFELPDNQKYIVYKFNIAFKDYYNLNLDSQTQDFKFFLDGNKVEEASVEKVNSKMILDKGEHELAIPIEQKNVTLVANEDQINLVPLQPFIKPFKLSDTPQTYQIDFDYQFINGGNLALYVTDDINIVIPNYLQYVSNAVSHASIQYNSNFGATQAAVQIQSDEDVKVRNLRIRLVKKPDPIFKMSNFSLTNPSKDNTSWDFIKINPAHYLVKITKNNPEEELLVFSETYDPKWKIFRGSEKDWENAKLVSQWRDRSKEYALREAGSIPTSLNDAPLISDDKHYLVNGFGNGWMIEGSGEYYLDLIFTPQHTLEIASIISKASILIISGALIFVFIRKRKYEKI